MQNENIKKYKFITIGQVLDETHEGETLYRIVGNRHGDNIGAICWYPQWKQYIFCSEINAVFNNSCLRDILDFMENHSKRPQCEKKS